MSKKIICILTALLLAAAAGAGIAGWLRHQKYAPMRADYERIENDIYDGVFFSTFPIDHFTEEDFAYYRAIYPLKASYCIPDAGTLETYFEKVAESGNEPWAVYLGIRPDIVTVDELIELMSLYPDKVYEIIVSYPSLKYWAGLSDKEYSAKMQAYQDFVNTLMPLCDESELMFSLYFYNAADWLVGNSAHYESDYNVNPGISHKISMFSDSFHGFMLTQDNYGSVLSDFEELTERSRTRDSEYPDLSKWDIVFFGDSVIAFDDTSSIPGALSGLTGAHTYNCARGGSGAVFTLDTTGPLPGISEIVDSFLAGNPDIFEEDSIAYRGMTEYRENAKDKRQKCFVLNFGLNDYYKGHAVSSDDPRDTNTYTGALRTAAEKLKAAYPDAVILLMTPNFTSYFGGGREPQSDLGGVLSDYASAVTSLAGELDCLLYDSYNLLGINDDNHETYLLDGTHPNEATRFIMAKGLAAVLGEKIQIE